MADDREYLGTCEECDTKISEGDRYHYTSDGCWLCEAHSPDLSDIIRQMDEVLADGDVECAYEGTFDSPQDLRAYRDKLAADLAENGDRKVFH